MPHPLSAPALVATLALAALPSVPAFAANGAIAFSQARYDANGIVVQSNLLLEEAGRVLPLTPARARTIDSAPSWSPDGSRVVFQRTSTNAPAFNRSHLFSVDRRGRLRAITPGAGNFLAPAWGPDGRIAYVSRTSRRDCLRVANGDGRAARDLFCVDAPAQLARPAWSADGRSLLVASGVDVGRMDPVWQGRAYRVDAASGAAARLVEVTMDTERVFEFSPDGRRAVLSDVVPNELSLVDLRTGAVRTIGTGYAPRWSRDGRRIAFTGEVYDDGPGGFRYYNPLYVMAADGSQPRQLTRIRVDNIAYTAADWSRDGTRILVTRRSFRDPSLILPSDALRMVDVATGAIQAAPAGYAGAGAWFDR